MTEPIRRPAPTADALRLRSTGGWHPPTAMLQRYADMAAMTPAQAASLEAHLDRCPPCRTQLAPRVTDGLLEAVGAVLTERAALVPQYRRARYRQMRLTAGPPLPWLLSALAVCLLAGLLDLVADLVGSSRPPVLVLLAPALPLLGVAAAWTPQLDPMHELTASTPGAGLRMLLRRALVVLAAVVALSGALSALAGAGAVGQLWLLPCLTLTTMTVAAGSVVGLHRAAAGLGSLWSLAVVVPGLAVPSVPLLLQPRAVPAWLAALLLAGLATAARRHAYQPASGRS